MTGSSGRSIDSLPYINVADQSAALIAECLEDGQAAVIHHHATMEDPFALEVIASRQIVDEVPKLNMMGTFVFHAATDPTKLHVIRDRYLRSVAALPLGALGVRQAFVSNEKRSLRLAHTDKPASVTTWFSPAGTPPYRFFVANARRDGRNLQVSSTPPKFDPETLEQDITDFMKLLSIPHRVLGGNTSEYSVDFIERRQPNRQAQRNQQQSRRDKKQNSPEAKSRPQKPNASKVNKGEVFQPRLPNPKARLEKIHGMDADNMEDIKNRILTFSHPQLAELYSVRSSGGILLHGPPGTGKTMTAGAICNEIEGATLWQIDGSDLINKYVGQSAANTKDVFAQAVEFAKKNPLVILLDEVDSIIGSKSEGHAEREAALGEFKRSIAHIADQVPNILLVATTNNIGNLDEAFMRPGRFDIKAYMGLPNAKARLGILMDHVGFQEVEDQRIFDPKMGEDIEIFTTLANATDGMSGGDIAAVIKACRFDMFSAHAKNSKYPGPITHTDILRKVTQHWEQPQVF